MRNTLLLIGACLLLFSGQLLAQSRTIIGKVTDAQGNAVQNATVLIKGTNAGTTTKADGTFSLNITSAARTLIFSSVGMTPVEINVGNKGVFNVSLLPAEKGLQEVVVVGYGTQKKSEVTGNTATIKGGNIAERPVQSFEAALSGKAAGVQVTSPNGVVNAPPVFMIRGTNSISLSSYPLIVVDGVVSPTGDYGGTNAPANALASINPNDIESIDIAKDAAATAIYGSRAANGVVFITTKKGKQGRPRVSYDGWVGQSQAIRLPKLLNAQQYTDYKNQALVNAGAPATTRFALTNDANGNPIDTKWYDYVYRKGFAQSHSINVSGGNDNTTYYFSVGYTGQQGIIRKNDFYRRNILANVDSRISKYFSAGAKISYSNESNLAAASSGSLNGEAFNSAGLARSALVNAPNVGPYKNDGSYNIGATYVGVMNNTVAQVGFFNPVVLLDLNRSNNEVNHIQPNVYFQAKPLSWMTLRTTFGMDYLLVANDLFWNPIHGDGQSYGGYASSSNGTYKTWVWDNIAQFDHTFADKHNLSLLVGSEQQRRTSSATGINRQNLSDAAYNLIQAGWINNNPSGMAFGENYLLSSFARLNYDFEKKYFFSANIRQDEYSALGEKKGIFYGASAGWELSKENFWESAGLNRLFSSFKVRGSYGKVGNALGLNDYATFTTFGSGLYGGNSTLYFSSTGNDHLKWETSKKTDVGFSFGMFKDRFTGEIAYYNNKIDELILNVPQAPSTGLPSSSTSAPPTVPNNVGAMYNRGIELTLGATPVQKKDFSWNTSFNFTANSNKVTKLAPGLDVIQTSTGGSETVNETVVGKSIGYLWVVRTGGIDANSGERIFINSQGNKVLYSYTAANSFHNPDGSKYISPKGSYQINQAEDGVLYKNTIPKFYGGFDNVFHYKGFDLDVLLTYQLGFYIYYGTNAGLHDQRYWNNTTDVLNAWTKPGDANASIPKPVYGDNVSNGSTLPLDINVFKGDFIKLKNVSLSYNIPPSLLSRTKLISSLRVYVSGQNLAVKTKYPGPDPEVSSNGYSSNSGQGVDRNTSANARTITVGVNVGF